MELTTATMKIEERGVSGEIGIRSADLPWWESAASLAADELRVERPGRLEHDPLTEDNAEPAEWVDVILRAEASALVRVRLQRFGGEVRRVGFEVYDATGELTTRMLRQTPGGLLDRIDALLSEWLFARLVGHEWRRQVRRPGRAGRPDVYYAEWAARYTRALEAAPDAPIKWLVAEEEAAGRYATEAQIRAYLTKARSRGLLTKSQAGVAGGRLTAKGRRVLQRAGIETGDQE